jgi:YegS/Rv2252/BmrU family lipid kinase
VGGGGDGTANEILNGLMKARQEGFENFKMGMLPVGRGNDFAYSMGIPTDLKTACEALAPAKSRLIDVGLLKGGFFPEGRYFGNGVGIGFDAVVGFEAAKFRRLSGMAGYVAGALKTMFLYFKAPLLEVTFNGKTVTQPCIMVSVMNGIRMGGTFFMAPQGKPADGVFDLTLVGQINQFQILMLLPRFMKGTQAGHPAVRVEKTAELNVKALKGSIPAHADGETMCTAGEQISIKLLPRQIQLICQGD